MSKGEQIMEKTSKWVWDKVSEARIKTLHPAIQDQVRIIIAELAQMGIYIRVTSAFRTFAEQEAEYAKGRTAPGSIVTNAKAGQSYHNYGLAVDVVEMLNGITPLWNNPNWNKIAAVFKKYGFEWGGDFTSIKDKPHFQKPFGYNTNQLYAMKNAGKTDKEGYLILAA